MISIPSLFSHGEPTASETFCLLWNTITPIHGRGEDKDDKILGKAALIFNEDAVGSEIQTISFKNSTPISTQKGVETAISAAMTNFAFHRGETAISGYPGAVSREVENRGFDVLFCILSVNFQADRAFLV